VPELETVVTDSSVVGNKVPLALTGGVADVTTALSVVGKSGGALAAGEGLGAAVVSGSGFWGSAGGLELFLSLAACCSFTCFWRVCTNSVRDWTCCRSASISAALAAGLGATGAAAGSAPFAASIASAPQANATNIIFFIHSPELDRDFARHETDCVRRALDQQPARTPREATVRQSGTPMVRRGREARVRGAKNRDAERRSRNCAERRRRRFVAREERSRSRHKECAGNARTRAELQRI